MSEALQFQTPLQLIFEQHRDKLQRALDHGGNTHTIEDVRLAVEREQMQLWNAKDAILISELLVYPQYKALHVFLAAGSLDTLLDMRPSVEEFARRLGCRVVSINGRKGWARALREYGYGSGLQTVAKVVDTIPADAG